MYSPVDQSSNVWLCDLRRILWDVYEAAPQGCLTTAVTATEYSGQQDGDKEASMSEFLLKDALVQALATLAQVTEETVA